MGIFESWFWEATGFVAGLIAGLVVVVLIIALCGLVVGALFGPETPAWCDCGGYHCAAWEPGRVCPSADRPRLDPAAPLPLGPLSSLSAPPAPDRLAVLCDALAPGFSTVDSKLQKALAELVAGYGGECADTRQLVDLRHWGSLLQNPSATADGGVLIPFSAGVLHLDACLLQPSPDKDKSAGGARVFLLPGHELVMSRSCKTTRAIGVRGGRHIRPAASAWRFELELPKEPRIANTMTVERIAVSDDSCFVHLSHAFRGKGAAIARYRFKDRWRLTGWLEHCTDTVDTNTHCVYCADAGDLPCELLADAEDTKKRMADMVFSRRRNALLFVGHRNRIYVVEASDPQTLRHVETWVAPDPEKEQLEHDAPPTAIEASECEYAGTVRYSSMNPRLLLHEPGRRLFYGRGPFVVAFCLDSGAVLQRLDLRRLGHGLAAPGRRQIRYVPTDAQSAYQLADNDQEQQQHQQVPGTLAPDPDWPCRDHLAPLWVTGSGKLVLASAWTTERGPLLLAVDPAKPDRPPSCATRVAKEGRRYQGFGDCRMLTVSYDEQQADAERGARLYSPLVLPAETGPAPALVAELEWAQLDLWSGEIPRVGDLLRSRTKTKNRIGDSCLLYVTDQGLFSLCVNL